MSLLSEFYEKVVLGDATLLPKSTWTNITQAHVPMKKSDGQGKGFAFVQYEDPDHAVQAYLENDGLIFQGRLLHIISANSKNTLDEFAISKLPLKKQKEARRKLESAKQTFNWNSLYLNASQPIG